MSLFHSPSASPRTHVRATKPPDVDRTAAPQGARPQELAAVFIHLRQYLKLSPYQAAALVDTETDVIFALEAGAISDLPAWPQTERIVRAYLGLANVDPSQVLRCIQSRIGPEVATARASRNQLSNESSTFGKPTSVRNRQQRLPTMIWRVGAVGVVLAALGLSTQSSMLQAAAGKLPAPIAELARTAQDRILIQFSPRFEGMALINVADPRTRRTDKLRITH